MWEYSHIGGSSYIVGVHPPWEYFHKVALLSSPLPPPMCNLFRTHARLFPTALGPPFLASASGQGLHPGDMAVPRCKKGYEPREIMVQVKSSLAAGGPLRLMICETKRREGEDVYFKAIGRRQAKGGDIWWGVARPTILETVNRWVERHGSQLITHQGEKAIPTWADQI